MWERDTRIYNLMLALRSARRSHGVNNPLLSIVSDLFRRLALPTAIKEKDFESLMNLTIAKIVDTIGAQAITVFLVEGDAIRFRYIYYSPTLYDLAPEKKAMFEETKKKLLETSLPLDKGVVGKVIATGETAVVEDVAKASRFFSKVDEETGFETKSMITVPLMGVNGPVGAIQVLNKVTRTGEVTHFSPEDVKLLEDVAEYSSKIFQKMVDPSFQLSDRDIARYIGKVCDSEVIEFSVDDIEPELLQTLRPDIVEKYHTVPIRKLTDGYLVATCNPLAPLLQSRFERDTGLKVEKACVTPRFCLDAVLRTLQQMGDS